MRASIIVACLMVPLAAAAAPIAEASDPVAASMLERTADGQPLIARAVALANTVLGPASRYHLAGSWDARPAPKDGVKTVTVHLVAPVREGGDFAIAVPFDCDCIFVQPAVLLAKIATFSDASAQMLRVDSPQAIVFMLLHELGHVAHGDAGKYADMRHGHDYNIEATDQKQIEVAADRFATDELIAAAADTKDVGRSIAAMRTEMALTQIAWNLAATRVLDNFGASSLCSRFVFADDGATHPNFELRILTANDLIVHTAETAELLARFESCRRAPARTGHQEPN